MSYEDKTYNYFLRYAETRFDEPQNGYDSNNEAADAMLEQITDWQVCEKCFISLMCKLDIDTRDEILQMLYYENTSDAAAFIMLRAAIAALQRSQRCDVATLSAAVLRLVMQDYACVIDEIQLAVRVLCNDECCGKAGVHA